MTGGERDEREGEKTYKGGRRKRNRLGGAMERGLGVDVHGEN